MLVHLKSVQVSKLPNPSLLSTAVKFKIGLEEKELTNNTSHMSAKLFLSLNICKSLNFMSSHLLSSKKINTLYVGPSPLPVLKSSILVLKRSILVLKKSSAY